MAWKYQKYKVLIFICYSEYYIDVCFFSLQVCVSGDYRSVKVFWMARESEDDSHLDDLLQKISGPLRHELSRLRIMGDVPKIQFVKGYCQ